MCLVCAYDIIIISKYQKVINKVIQYFKDNHFSLTEKRKITKVLAIDIKIHKYVYYELTHPQLIQQVIKYVGLEKESKHNKTPSLYRSHRLLE